MLHFNLSSDKRYCVYSVFLLYAFVQISRREVDSFRMEQPIPPSCHFLAKWISQDHTMKDLEAVVKLTQKDNSPREIKLLVTVSQQLTQGTNCQVSRM